MLNPSWAFSIWHSALTKSRLAEWVRLRPTPDPAPLTPDPALPSRREPQRPGLQRLAVEGGHPREQLHPDLLKPLERLRERDLDGVRGVVVGGRERGHDERRGAAAGGT